MTGYATTRISTSGDDIPFAVTLDSSGNIVVAGTSNQSNSSGVFTVARYTSSGVLDTSFGCATSPCPGDVTTSITGNLDSIRGVAIDSAGKILAAGTDNLAGTTNRWNVVRYTANGVLDTTFNSTGAVPGISSISFTYDFNVATAIALQSDGSIVVGGAVQVGTLSGFPITNIGAARLTSSGVLDTTFNSTGSQPGTQWTSFGSNQSSFGYALLIQPDGKIVLSGDNMNFALVRYNSDGSLDTTFNASGPLPGTITTLFSKTPSYAFGLDFNPTTQKLTAGGYAWNGSKYNFALARYYDNDTDNTPPTVTITTPANGAQYKRHSTVDATTVAQIVLESMYVQGQWPMGLLSTPAASALNHSQ